MEVLQRHHTEGRDVRLIVTDVQMPQMDGLSLAENIRRQSAFSTIPIILISSSVQQGEPSRCRALGHSAYLSKPVQPSELFDAMLDMLSIKKPAAQTKAMRTAEATSARKRAMKILLAEDNAVNRKLAKTLLEKHGYTVVNAENGREALEVLGREQIDLILMDMQMPVMDGFEAMRAIRESERDSGKHIRIVALTAHAMKGDRARCLEAGADDYVTKPIRTTELLAALDRSEAGAPVGEVAAGSASAAPGAILDVQRALQRLDGDSELLEELATLFADEGVKNIRDIHEAFAAADAKLLERLAHTVKGASANIGAASLSHAALVLEELARSGDLTNAAEKIAALERELARLLPAIKSLARKTADGVRS